MSHLRAPAARPDRREGGRHGRSATRAVPTLPEIHIRPQLLRLAVLPPTAVALSACAAVLFTVRSTGARPGMTLWAVLAGAVAVALAGILIAAVAAGRTAKSVRERLAALSRISTKGDEDLRELVEALRRGEQPPARGTCTEAGPDADDFEQLTTALTRAHDSALTTVVQASQLSSHAGSEQKLEVFVNLARRLQSLVQREISILDDLENEIEDPDLLKGLFHVDHLATRIRRHAENLAVLGGAVSRRQWSNPVSMTEVLRSAIAEVEQYSRIKLVPPIDGTLRGHAVADVIHLLAELVENATVFSAPHTQVLLRANLVTSGLVVEVEDRGLGMPVTEQNKMNALLADPDQVNVASLLQDGRIGLFVVSQLARRHGIQVRLQTNIYGGVQAAFVIPQGLLGNEPDDSDDLTQPQQSGAVRRPTGTPRHAQTAPSQRTSTPGTPDRSTPGTPDHGVGRASDHGLGRASGSSGGRISGGGSGSVSDCDAGRISDGGPVTGPFRPTAVHGTHAAPTHPGHAFSVNPGHPASAQPGPSEPGGPTAPGQPRPSVPRQQGPARGGGQQGPGGIGGGAAPLPVRGARDERPNPAEAMPGIRPEDRRTIAENSVTPPTPRVGGPIRGTMGKPQLPRRRAQQHIVPQLRGGPAPMPRQDPDHYIGHDPGLMAAFQRGIGLAEARQMETSDWDTSTLDTTPVDLAPPDAATRIDAARMDLGRGLTDPTPRLGGPTRGAAPIAVPPSNLDAAHDLTSRHDGSTPAG